MTTKLHIAADKKRFGLRRWKWAAGMKPRKSDRYWWAGEGLKILNHADVNHWDIFPEPTDFQDGNGYSGYVRRIKRRAKK